MHLHRSQASRVLVWALCWVATGCSSNPSSSSSSSFSAGAFTVPDPPPITAMPPSEVVAYADQFSGVDTAAKIAAAIASLPSTGGVVDAQAFQGVNAWSSNPFDG